jgi:NADH-quinone oxidoreductase subunit L
VAGDDDCAAGAAGSFRRGAECRNVLRIRIFVFDGRAGSFPVSPYTSKPARPWINIGALHIDFSFVLDQLSLVMLLVVTGVGFLIHIYSVGYMGRREGYARYFSYLNLFLFFMTVLVLAGNALLMFVGWEGVGLASYLLIGFYFQKKSAADAGKKAFIVNRIGDFGFLIGMFLLLANFGTLTFQRDRAKLGRIPAGRAACSP